MVDLVDVIVEGIDVAYRKLDNKDGITVKGLIILLFAIGLFLGFIFINNLVELAFDASDYIIERIR